MKSLAFLLACAMSLAALYPLVPSGQAAFPEDRGIAVWSLPGQRVPPPSRSGGTFTARILVDTAIRSRPAGTSVTWVARVRTRWSGSGQKLMVLGSRLVRGEFWLRVRLPIRPNGSYGWVRRDRVALSRSGLFILIDRSQRKLLVFRKGRMVRRWRVVVGAPSTPTPLGLFAVYDRVKQRNPRGFIGPWAMPLTAHSNALRRYNGGPGLVALHGRDGASLRDPLGSAASHGCVRMSNGRIRYLIRASLGTAVRIQQ